MHSIYNEYPIQKLDPRQFPPLLKEIPDPPKSLYSKGVIPGGILTNSEMKYICIVGSRKCTNYGKDACREIIRGLRGYPVVIVSGLAFGIDSIAHEAALEYEISTIAVPGSGLNADALYPKHHFHLAEQILASGGALLSEYEPDLKAAPWCFPQRNRIMAGLCHATIIIEAELKSGTLITSKLATEYNREVFAVPGSIFSAQSDGPNSLIKQGAIPVSSAKDILDELF